MKLGIAIHELHRSENDLAHELLQISDRHKTDHEVFYVARDLARWSQDHVRELAEIARDYDVGLDPEPHGETTIAERVRQKGAELVGRRSEPALLLRDLREVHMKAAGVSLDWELLGQAAQGARQPRLLELTERCHPESLRQMQWAKAKLKIAATQALVS
jgi:hypothetical protein